MAVIALVVAALSLAAGGSAETSDLRITLWPTGPDDGGARSWRLRCGPAGGTLPRPGTACTRLAALTRPFAPVPKDVGCAQIYGGPQVARVVGTFRGRRVWATFKRTDACEIARWNRVRFLFPAAVGPR